MRFGSQTVRSLVLLLSSGAVLAQAQPVYKGLSENQAQLRILGGVGYDSGKVSPLCGDGAAKECVVEFEVSIDAGTGKCSLPKKIDRASLAQGQDVRFRVISAEPSLEFDEAYGILIGGNKDALGRPFVNGCGKDPQSGKEFVCTRAKIPGAGLQFPYDINLVYLFNSRPRLCHIDPLIVSRD